MIVDIRFSGDDSVLAALVFDGNYSIYAWLPLLLIPPS